MALQRKMAIKDSKNGVPEDMIDWNNVDVEVQLFYAMRGHKPVGVNRHFQMACILDKFRHALRKEIGSHQIWDHLETMYDMSALHESEIVPFPNDTVDFSLPDREFGLLIKKEEIKHSREQKSKEKESKETHHKEEKETKEDKESKEKASSTSTSSKTGKSSTTSFQNKHHHHHQQQPLHHHHHHQRNKNHQDEKKGTSETNEEKESGKSNKPSSSKQVPKDKHYDIKEKEVDSPKRKRPARSSFQDGKNNSPRETPPTKRRRN